MLVTSAALRREAIRNTLAQLAGTPPESKAIAYCAVEVWTKVISRLEPVIGPRGVDALFRRALHQTSTEFPWLGTAESAGKSGVVALENLKTCIAAQDTASGAAEASCSLLVRFVELLAGLIGESLMERLLSPVWAPPLPASDKESGS